MYTRKFQMIYKWDLDGIPLEIYVTDASLLLKCIFFLKRNNVLCFLTYFLTIANHYLSGY